MIDLQVNGAGGVAFPAAPAVDDYRKAASALASHGTDLFLATIPSAPLDRYPRILAAAANALDAGVAGLAGVHLEGPFLSESRRGAHRIEHLAKPDAEWLAALCDAHDGLVRMVTLAPELPGALDVVDACRERGILVSVGHSQASPDEAATARPDMVTHLFNGMDPFHHRNPGLAGWALAEPGVVCGLIADGVHVDPIALRIAFAAKTGAGIALVSDAVAGERDAAMVDGAWRLTDGTLAGAAVYQDRGAEVCRAAGIPDNEIVAATSTTPARLLGLS